jgi:ribosomal protein L32
MSGIDILLYCPNCGKRQALKDPSVNNCPVCGVTIDLSHNDFDGGKYVIKVK